MQWRFWKKHAKHPWIRNILLLGISGFFVICALILVWISFIELPDFKAFEERKVENSTKIYDSTGETLLYDTNRDIRRTEIPFEAMGDNIKKATIAIEDQKFYEHNGVRITSFIRAMLVNIVSGSFSQGGSTITQQVVKNSLLNQEKTISRKIKEWVLAIKLEKVLSKDEILALYLNDNPYGGTIYGIEEASRAFFGKEPSDLTYAEAAYIAAIPKAPSYYSPFGNHRDKLDERKNLVLSEMKSLGYITDEEYNESVQEEVIFLPQAQSSIKAPHFVFYIESYLEDKYGPEALSAGLTVTTTLNWELQEKAEEIVKRNALKNETDWNASNEALVAIDPTTGGIITMVGSRDYFDKEIDGAYNIATAKRQPGSSFKPFVYATAFKEGYTPDTVLFDVPTEFNSSCNAYGVAIHAGSNCYMPSDYDGKYLGPITLRNALAQSRNIPAVQLLYLVGLKDSIKTARDMGITTLRDDADYGLTLVLGGGEVSLLDMVSAYGVFANEGVRLAPTSILKVEDRSGNILESYTPHPEVALDRNVALTIDDVLSDNVARTPLFGSNSFLYFGGKDVAGKTGTTNNNRDAWLIGYTPSVVVGVWSGNNDNTSMKKGSAISGPVWREYMDLAIQKYPSENFPDPVYDYKGDYSIKPVLRGVWLGNDTFIIDSMSGGLATEYTPEETKVEKVIPNVHTTLYWLSKDNPRGPVPENPSSDPQYKNWEQAVQDWWVKNAGAHQNQTATSIPTTYDNLHTENSQPVIEKITIQPVTYSKNTLTTITPTIHSLYTTKEVSYSLNGTFLGKSVTPPFTFSFVGGDVSGDNPHDQITVVAEDIYKNKGTFSQNLN